MSQQTYQATMTTNARDEVQRREQFVLQGSRQVLSDRTEAGNVTVDGNAPRISTTNAEVSRAVTGSQSLGSGAALGSGVGIGSGRGSSVGSGRGGGIGSGEGGGVGGGGYAPPAAAAAPAPGELFQDKVEGSITIQKKR